MRYLVAIETIKMVEVEAPTEAVALDTVRNQLQIHPTDTTTLSVVPEVEYDEANNIYKVKGDNQNEEQNEGN